MDTLLQLLDQDGYAQVLIELEPGTATSNVQAEAAQLQLAGHFLDPEVAGQRPPGAILTSELGAGLSANAPIQLQYSNAAGVGPTPPVRVFPTLRLALGYVDSAGLKTLAATPGIGQIVRAEVPSLVRPVQVRIAAAAVPGNSWGVERIGAPELWAQGFLGEGVLIGHVDTGVDGKHPALAGAIQAFTEFDLNGDIVPSQNVSGEDGWDSDDHGTHTAGTIVGRHGAHGAFGVAPAAKLASAMVIEGGKILDRILGGMEWAAQHGAQIMNASLGLPGQSPVFHALVAALRARNILPVFAVGNEGPGMSRFPGNYINVLSVGASDEHDQVAVFSGSQRFMNPVRMVPDVVAPGDNIRSSIPNGGFATMSGSSMATPHIAGLAALLLSAMPGASADDLEAAIQDSAELPPTMAPQRANRGIPNGPRALQLLRERLLVA
jgi:subtilisin